MVALYFVTNVLRYFYTGFIFNMNLAAAFNILMELLSSVVLVFLWTVANWSVSTLMDGEGRLRRYLDRELLRLDAQAPGQPAGDRPVQLHGL